MLYLSNAERTYKKKMDHLEKVTPVMLTMYFSDNRGDPDGRANAAAADRVSSRFIGNFHAKLAGIKQLWMDCEEADLGNTLARVDIDGRFDHLDPKKAFTQITNGYIFMLDGLINSGCKQQTRYQRLRLRLTVISDMLKFHYCHKVRPSDEWCNKHRSNPRMLTKNN